jgi:hypothetical protein
MKKRYFGIELEIGNEKTQKEIRDFVSQKSAIDIITTSKYGKSVNNFYWHIKYDSSCGVLGKPKDFGWEIASFKAIGSKQLKHIAEIAQHLKNNDCKVNLNCGLHIHVDVSDFSIQDIGCLLIRWVKSEEFLFKTLPLNRRNNFHCKPLISKENFNKRCNYTRNEIWDLLKPSVLKDHENNDKRYSLNLINYAKFLKNKRNKKRVTIELRIPEGTLDYTDVYNWGYFFVNFVDSCKNCVKKDPVTNCIKLETFFKNLNIQDDFLKKWFENRYIKYRNI